MMGYKGKRWKVRGQRGEERCEKESEQKRERGSVKVRGQRDENRVEETAETSPDASLHTLSGSISHANTR